MSSFELGTDVYTGLMILLLVSIVVSFVFSRIQDRYK